MTPERWQQVKAVFQSALEGEASQRAAFLDLACADDPVLRRQVEALIASHEQEPSFLEAPAFDVAPPALEEDEAGLMIGERIGPYRLVREIGHGGMGAVYLAVRADDEYQKQVAIKLVKRGMDTDAILRRFRNERQILANLDHPHIAKLLDGGTTSDGLPYFVMDFVEGLPIDVYCDKHELPTLERLKLFRTVCSAVHYAHQHHVVHRDLKPSNIFVAADGLPKLLDFGIAKLFNPDHPSQTVDSTATLRFMTPEYASPEQIRGETVTTASDVYSLGVLLYELLTGHRPYRLANRTPPEVERIICAEEPEKPSTVIGRVEEVPGGGTVRLTPEVVSRSREDRPETLRRCLAGDLDTIVLMALRKEPERRYGTVEQFSEDIRRHLEGLPVTARRDTLGYRTTKFVRRNKAGVFAAALFAAVIVALVTVGLYLLSRPDKSAEKPIASLAVLSLENLSGDPAQDYFADGMTEALINDLAKIGALRVISRQSVMKFKGTRTPLPEIARTLGVDAVMEGAVLRSGNKVRITAQLIDPATDRHLWALSYERNLRDVLALQAEVARDIASKVRVRLTAQERARLAKAPAVNPEAYDFYLRGRSLGNRHNNADSQAAIEMLEQAVAIDPAFAAAHARLAMACVDRYFYFAPEDQSWWEAKANAAVENALSLDADLSDAYLARGRLLWTPSNHFPHERATQELRRAIALNPNSDDARYELALVLNHIGLNEEALQEAQAADAINPTAKRPLFQIGQALLYQGNYEEALSVLLGIPKEFNPGSAGSYIAWALFQLGRRDEAVAKLEEYAKEYPQDTGTRFAAVQALLYAAAGEKRRALDKIQSASKKKDFGHFHHTAYYIASAYAQMSQPVEAISWLRHAADNGFPCYPLFERDPSLDPIRKNPGFMRLMAKLKAQWEHYKATLFQ